jgi:acyl-CoA thioester hydrolase
MVESGTDMVVAEATVRYLAPLRFDEEFEVEAAIKQMGTTSLITEMSVVRAGERVAEGEIRHVFIAASDGGKKPLPDEIREVLERYAA